MAFTEYAVRKSVAKGKMEPTDVKIAVSGKKNLNLSIVIGYELLKTCGLIIGDKVALYFGTDEDKGKLLIKKSETGGIIAAYSHKKGSAISPHGQIIRKVAPVPPIEDFTNRTIAIEKVECQWDVDAAGLVVTLPIAFFP